VLGPHRDVRCLLYGGAEGATPHGVAGDGETTHVNQH